MLRANPAGCFAARSSGRRVGFVTSIPYLRSGWIGNLLVAQDCRERGIGRRLFEAAMGTLVRAGVETIWITASAAGAPLYESLGFQTIDTIQRWRAACPTGCAAQSCTGTASVEMIDAAGWGDDRQKLLQPLLHRGRLMIEPDGFLLLQESSAGTQIGPWGALSEHVAAALLDKLCARRTAESMFLDAPAGNPGAAELLASRGFTVTGSTQLMYRGEAPAYDPGKIFALATMGSMG